jgi:hypothetical protein
VCGGLAVPGATAGGIPSEGAPAAAPGATGEWDIPGLPKAETGAAARTGGAQRGPAKHKGEAALGPRPPGSPAASLCTKGTPRWPGSRRLPAEQRGFGVVLLGGVACWSAGPGRGSCVPAAVGCRSAVGCLHWGAPPSRWSWRAAEAGRQPRRALTCPLHCQAPCQLVEGCLGLCGWGGGRGRLGAVSAAGSHSATQFRGAPHAGQEKPISHYAGAPSCVANPVAVRSPRLAEQPPVAPNTNAPTASTPPQKTHHCVRRAAEHGQRPPRDRRVEHHRRAARRPEQRVAQLAQREG